MNRRHGHIAGALVLFVVVASVQTAAAQTYSVARQWDEKLLNAIRVDYARPTVHARNLFHFTIAIWDAWAVYDDLADPVLSIDESPAPVGGILASREEAISYAAYRVLSARFADSPGAGESIPSFDAKMDELGYDRSYVSLIGNSPAAVGNRIAVRVLSFGLADGANEAGGYEDNLGYAPVNPPLIVKTPGDSNLVDPNRWQPLALDFFVDQSGNPIPGDIQIFLGPHWGHVTPFALTAEELSEFPGVYYDPGLPPQLGGAEDAEYKDMFKDVALLSALLTPDGSPLIDISPGARGNNTLGTDDGTGHALNPVTGEPYEPQLVKLGDYARVIAEFWADGPDSETPPGHWNTLANYVSDHPMVEKRFQGVGPVLDDLEWDVKMYLMINGAVHDAAVAAWGNKGYYDYVRPISAIRHMAGLGQSSDSSGPSYHPNGIPLEPGNIEVITEASSMAGERHEALADHVGDIALYGWLGVPADPNTEYSGVGWILASTWVPYQRDTFVTPPFSGYISGHSTFSRAGAEVLTFVTGSEFFPGGLGEYHAPQNAFLVFEVGPSEDITMQWATYYDAADEAGISRLYGGIHPRADDYPGRIIGSQIGIAAYRRAVQFFEGTAHNPSLNSVQLWGLYQ